MKTIPLNYVDTTKYIAKIGYDDSTEDPLQWSLPEERGVTFVLHHKRYNLPCEISVNFDHYDNYTDMAKRHPVIKKAKFVKYVQWYEHSGVAVSLEDTENARGFDTGIAGIVFGDNEDTINAVFSDWSDYIEGNVYYCSIETDTGVLIDSCGGLYGTNAVNEYISEMIGNAQVEKEYI